MNFTSVHGYNAYTQFAAKVKETASTQKTSSEQVRETNNTGSESNDPVDIVSISKSAKRLSISYAIERETAQSTLKEWIKESGSINSAVNFHTSGKMMTELLADKNLSLNENKSYDINMDVWCAVSVTEKNIEKAKAIQNLLNTTPSGINWGFLLQKLPVDA